MGNGTGMKRESAKQCVKHVFLGGDKWPNVVEFYGGISYVFQ
jgi:hypothetical protein